MAKVTKESVNYRNNEEGNRHCEDCTMWRYHLCTLVAGYIKSHYTCDEFERKK